MAKKKTQRISVNALDEVMKNIGDNSKVVEWNGIEVTITPTLPLDEMLSFARGVVSSCFDQQTGEYIPEARDFAIRVNIMQKYANFNLPANAEKQYDAAMRSGAVEMIVSHINNAQFNQIVDAINDKIENTAAANVQAAFRKLEDVTSSFDEMQTKMSGLFENISQSDVERIISAMSDGRIDEEKIVKAYIENTSDE